MNHADQLKTEAFRDGMDLHLEMISVCKESNEGENAAILGLQVHLRGKDDIVKTLEPIGKVECNSKNLSHLMQLRGPDIGSIKLNFEADHTGVAIKVRRKHDDYMMYKTGERKQELSHIWTIPEGYEIVGFHGSMNANDEIVELGIVTRISNFPSICLDAVHDIATSVERINSKQLSKQRVELLMNNKPTPLHLINQNPK